MNTASNIKRRAEILERPYLAALRRYLKQQSATSLRPALRLGQQAVALGLETLELSLIHEKAMLTQVLPLLSTAARERMLHRAGKFFAEAALPMEERRRTALESNLRLSRLNQALRRRTQDLDTSNRQLKKEVARRQRVEETLRQSEQHTHRLLEESRRLQQQLRLLSRQVLSAQEEERKRISRELHDVIAQMLTGINIRLATLKTEAAHSTQGLTKSIANTQRLVEKSVNIVHRFARELRPAVLDDLGLISALHSLMKGFTDKTGIPIKLTAFAGVDQLDGTRRAVLYRVAQEALTNVARHAHASQVEAHIQQLPAAVRLQIKDNGKSFDVDRVLFSGNSKRIGLLGMRERVEMIGGRLSIESAPGKGTTINAQIPFRTGVKKGSRL